MFVYSYDGTEDGFYSVCKHIVKTNTRKNCRITSGEYHLQLFDTLTPIATNEEDKKRIIHFLQTHCSSTTYWYWQCTMNTSKENHDLLSAAYLEAAVEYRRNVDQMVADPRVYEAHELTRRVLKEVHRMHGILRFEQLEDGLYYSRCEPDHDILAFLAAYFQKRIPDQSWVIHDLKRCKALLYDVQSLQIVAVPTALKPSLCAQEQALQSLWKHYHTCISIAERKNLKLQQQFVPNRYRKYMVEFTPHTISNTHSDPNFSS